MNTTQIGSLRRARGWTQERLAEESGVAVRTIQRLEAGNDASLESLSRIADALQVGVKDLFITVEDTAMAAAVEGLDERRLADQRHAAAIASHRRIWTIVGSACTTIGVLTAIAATYPGNGWPYLIGGLVVVTIGSRMIHDLPRRLPIALAWITAGVAIGWTVGFGWSWWLHGCSAVTIIAIASIFTWLSARHPQTNRHPQTDRHHQTKESP